MPSYTLLLLLLWGCGGRAQANTIGGMQATYDSNGSRYPCAFIDTVNISGAYALDETHNAYMHDWMVIPRSLVAVYDFVIYNGERLRAERHLRACVCRLKPCLRFCCPSGQYYDIDNRTCSAKIGAAGDTDATDQREMHVRLLNGSSAALNTTAHFAVHVGVPCEKMRLIMKDQQLVKWTLYENGTIAHRNHLFSKHYCYTAYQRPNNSTVHDSSSNNMTTTLTTTTTAAIWEWQPLACAPEKLPFILGVKQWTYAICLIIAVICMFIILLVHLLCNELRNTFYGVAIKAYTMCIIIGYSLLANLTWTNPANSSKTQCGNIACCIVLYLLLSFLLLCFISFNFYLNFHGIILTKLMFWLIFFPMVLLAVGWALFTRYDHFGGKPVLGYDTCWFDPRNLSIVVYLYAPMFVACLICGLFYVVTLVSLSERKAAVGVNNLAARIEENRLKSFWSFFAYTFVAWFVCLLSFAYHYYRGEPTHIDYAVCLFMALHGFGALYALVGKNQQMQHFLRRIDRDVDGDDADDDDEDAEVVEDLEEADVDVVGGIDDIGTGAGASKTAPSVSSVPMKHF